MRTDKADMSTPDHLVYEAVAAPIDEAQRLDLLDVLATGFGHAEIDIGDGRIIAAELMPDGTISHEAMYE